jgi:tetratricopeptide (TPR) repeat protein
MSNLDFYIDRPETDQLLNGLKQSFQSPANSPLVFHAYGIGGIGKTALTKKIRQDFSDAVVVRIDTGIEIKTETPLEVMDKIYHQLPALSDGWREDFSDKYRQYQETRRLIEQDTQGKDLIKVTQSVAQATLPKVAGEMVKHGSQAIIDSPRSIESFEKFLVNFPKTKGKTEDKEALRNLMLDPYGVLTKLLVTALLARANRQPLILIFDTYEQVGKDVDDWLLQYLLREHHLQDKLIRLVITGRQRLSSRSDYRGGWQKLEQDRGCTFEVQIPRFNQEQTTEYLQRAGIQSSAEIQRIYSITKGWPYYLKEVAKQPGRLDFSQIEEDLSGFLLRTASSEQRELVRIASCCRGFNTEILNELWQALGKESISSELYDWLKGLSFISKQSGIWRFDDVSRDIFRKTLFDDNPLLFEQVNRSLANYFGKQSNSYLTADLPITSKYQNEDWLREHSSFLYHSLFLRQPDFNQFVTHLLEAHYFQRDDLTSEVVKTINSETPLRIHPNLSTDCRDFLIKVLPIVLFDKFLLESPQLVRGEQEQIAISKIWQYGAQSKGLARFVMLYCQASHKKVDEARSLLQEALQQAETIKIDCDPEFSSNLFLSNVGNRFLEINCYEEALSSYDRAISIKSDFREAWNNRGNSLHNLGKYQEAIDSYDKAISLKSDYHEAWYNRGISLNDLGRCEEAITSYDRAIAIKPNYHEAWNNRGYTPNDLGRNEEAITSCDRAIFFKPDFHEAWHNWGNSLNDLGRCEEAIKYYDRAISFKPDFHEAWHGRGNSLGRLGRYEETITSYDKALEIKPDFHEAWFSRGGTLFNLGRHEEAISSYDKVLEIKPDYHHEVWSGRGNSLLNLERYEEAIDSYDRALAIKPDSHEVWNNKGISQFILGRYEEATVSYDQAVDIKIDFHEAWYGRGNSLFILERYEEATVSYDQVLTIKPDYYEAWNNRGAAYFKWGKYSESINCCEQVIAIQMDKYDSWHDKGLVHFVTSDYVATLTSWQQAFNYINDPKVPRYQEDISGLIQEFIEELIPRFTQPPIQQTLLIPLLEIYKKSNVITELGAALVNTLHLIVAPTLSDHTAAEWLSLWRTSSLGNEPAMELPLRLMSTSIEYKKDPSKRQRLWLNLPSEERPILDKALKLSD